MNPAAAATTLRDAAAARATALGLPTSVPAAGEQTTLPIHAMAHAQAITLENSVARDCPPSRHGWAISAFDSTPPADLAERWRAELDAASDASACWSLSYLRGGLRLCLAGMSEQPLAIVNAADGGWQGCRISIELAPGAVGTLVLVHQPGAARRQALGIEVLGGAGSQLVIEECDSISGEGDNLVAQRLHTINAVLEADAQLRWTVCGGGAGLLRRTWQVLLRGKRATADLAALAAVPAGAQVHDHVRVTHAVGPSTSRQLFKQVAHGLASCDASVHVAVGADLADAAQRLHGLELSPGARVVTRPQLDIHADDVTAKHAATVGRSDHGELFYLRSRGLDAADAQNLLLASTTGEVLERFSPATRLLADRTLADLLAQHSKPAA